jgi:hypothetical protein
MCHMLADSLSELHAMAAAIGMNRAWFQPFSFPHYDIAKGRREDAVRRGAVEVSRQEVAAIMRRLRADPEFMTAWKAEVRGGAA